VAIWHVAATLFLFRWIFRDPKVDVRFLAFGALLPDLVDLPTGTLVDPDTFATGELWMHTLLVPSLLTVVILVATRRGRRRRAWMALVVGMFFHLLLDGMWTSAEAFLWPLFGAEFPRQPLPYWPNAWDRATSDPWRWLLEIAGLVYLVMVWRAGLLGDPRRRREFFTTGRIASAAEED
jgi:hypothetical protein